jgi:hypothetical protein|tara:strand:- start:948 stop:1112 length:165 start_codon:yes stop_codon:yes gene_type:complete
VVLAHIFGPDLKCAVQLGMRLKGWQSIWPFLYATFGKGFRNFDEKTASPCTSLL